jgi:ribosomal-protein-alanine N-acetyltransferase
VSRLLTLGVESVDRLAELHASAFPRPWNAGDLVEMIDNLGAAILAIEEQARLVGFVMLQVGGGEAEILTLAVRPEARRTGLGFALVEAAATMAAAQGAEALWLEVAADNDPALSLYTRAGFEQTGRRRGYYRTGPATTMDAIIMRRALNTPAG